jgi:rhodanese-related sulfurtransferase
MTVTELKKVLDNDPEAILVDVREVAEFTEIRAKRAQLVPLSQFSVDHVRQLAPDLSVPIYLICRSGARSMRAAQILEQAGYSNLVNIEGGTNAWAYNGFEVAHG